ncbi:hypothetical protein [Burkholderia sp. ABCPW 14]|uniref:hypothetical protein n=1 Tax=Burkholderia sp. ABCPW 14 TaxID=1637860 RepID=UPI000AF4DE5C|nr:hypothetical protein [Burkholderia sp. ABCPW 14]
MCAWTPSIPSIWGTAISRLRLRRISTFSKSLERSQLLGLFRFYLWLASLISCAKIEVVASMMSRVQIGISAALLNRGIAGSLVTSQAEFAIAAVA